MTYDEIHAILLDAGVVLNRLSSQAHRAHMIAMTLMAWEALV